MYYDGFVASSIVFQLELRFANHLNHLKLKIWIEMEIIALVRWWDEGWRTLIGPQMINSAYGFRDLRPDIFGRPTNFPKICPDAA